MAGQEMTIEEMRSEQALRRLLSAYTDSVNRRQWSELRELFLADAKIELETLQAGSLELTGPDALGRFIAGFVARIDFFQFVLLNARLEIDSEQGSARGRLFICEYRWEKAVASWTQVFGVYQDHYRRIDRRWFFERRAFAPLVSVGNEHRVVEFPGRFSAFLASDA